MHTYSDRVYPECVHTYSHFDLYPIKLHVHRDCFMKVVILTHIFVAMLCWYISLFINLVADAEVKLFRGSNLSPLLVPDHGFVRHDQIDDFYPDMPRDILLVGITSFNSCCSRDFTTDGKEIGWWFYPNETEVPKIQNEEVVWDFFTSRYKKNVFLYRRGGGENGIHRLDIPVSATKNETLYVGLYPSAGRHTRLMQLKYSYVYEDTFTLNTQYITSFAKHLSLWG